MSELDDVKKLITKNKNRLYYVLNKDKVNAKRKEYKRKSRVITKLCPDCMMVMEWISGNQNGNNYKCRVCNSIWNKKVVK